MEYMVQVYGYIHAHTRTHTYVCTGIKWQKYWLCSTTVACSIHTTCEVLEKFLSLQEFHRTLPLPRPLLSLLASPLKAAMHPAVCRKHRPIKVKYLAVVSRQNRPTPVLQQLLEERLCVVAGGVASCHVTKGGRGLLKRLLWKTSG